MDDWNFVNCKLILLSEMYFVVFPLLLVLSMFRCIAGADCPGCVDLDVLSFDRLIERFAYALIKFDNAFPYGDKHEEFASLSQYIHKTSSDLLMGMVGVKNYGEFQNKQLAERFHIKSDDFPVVVLFRRERKDHVFYPTDGSFTVEDLKSFLRNHTSLYISCNDCLKEFDELVGNFQSLPLDERQSLIVKALEMSAKLSNERHKKSAQIYIKYMQRFSAGAEVNGIDEEAQRLTRIANGPISKEKKGEFELKLNILKSFQSVSRSKDEL